MEVRFSDGDVRWGIFNGTANLAQAALFPTMEEAWEHRKTCTHGLVERVGRTGVPYRLPGCAAYEENDGEPVECWTNYGGEWHWKATATKTHLTSNHEAEGEVRGTPDWVIHGE